MFIQGKKRFGALPKRNYAKFFFRRRNAMCRKTLYLFSVVSLLGLVGSGATF